MSSLTDYRAFFKKLREEDGDSIIERVALFASFAGNERINDIFTIMSYDIISQKIGRCGSFWIENGSIRPILEDGCGDIVLRDRYWIQFGCHEIFRMTRAGKDITGKPLIEQDNPCICHTTSGRFLKVFPVRLSKTEFFLMFKEFSTVAEAHSFCRGTVHTVEFWRARFNRLWN